MGAGDINLIAKIAPKNDAFQGMVDANQVLGDTGSTIPDNALAPSSVFQFGSPVFGIYVSGTTGSAIGEVILTGSTNMTIERTGSEFIFTAVAEAGGGGSPTFQHTWIANGPYQVDTDVDGAYISDTGFDITGIWLWRNVSGTAGSTIIDLNINGTTTYATQDNRPTILFDGATHKIDCTLPDTTTISQGDIITIDIDEKEDGTPTDLSLTIEGS